MAVAYQDTSYGAEYEYRIALIGRTGSGKSASGNSILGWEAFESQLSASSVTKKCKFQTAERFDKKLVVADTPGLYDIQQTSYFVTKEILKCVGILTPGPHAFILVVQVGRFTPEEQDTITHFSRIFGDKFFRYLIVLFTRKDELEKANTTIEEYVTDAPDELKNILQRCNHKFVAFDNTSKGQENDLDARKLVSMVKDIMDETGESYFSNTIFEIAELQFQRRARKNRLMEEKKIQEEMEDVRKEKQERELKVEHTEIGESQKEVEARDIELKIREETRHLVQINIMRDDDRRKYENDDDGVLTMLGNALLAIGRTLWSWISRR